MPTPSTANLPIPKDWNEFEDICADLFSKEWGDRNASRNGRQGQRQNGVDIYGSPATGGLAGVQCKGKRSWPPKQLTTAEIDVEVAEAKKFDPPLSELTIATAAPDDATLQAYVRKITQRHKQEGLFTVHIAGWGELTRRLNQHDPLVEKHFNFVGLSSVRDQIAANPKETAKLVVDQLREVGIIPTTPTAPAASSIQTENGLTGSISQALDRDLAERYRKALQRHSFPELSKINEFAPIANEILEGGLSAAGASIRRRILLRAARADAIYGAVTEAERFLTAAKSVPAEDSTLPADARILEAKDQIDDAIALLRDEKDADARSTLINIIARRRGEDACLQWIAQTNLTASDLTPAGVHTLANVHLQKNDIEATRSFLQTVPESILAESPYLLFLRSAIRLGSLLPKPDRQLALLGFPIDVRTAHPIADDATVAAELDAALDDLRRVQPLLADLGLVQAQRLAACLVTWCDLLHPQRKSKAIERLRTQMAKPETALPNLQFAFAYDPEFDPSAIRAYLDNREKLVGWNDDDLRAALILRIHGEDPHELATFLAQYRTRLEGFIGKEAVVALEVQVLARAKDVVSARLVLDKNRDAITPEMARVLEAEVARAEGADPVVALRDAYEATKNADALRNLVAELIRRKDFKALAHFGEKLYGETGDPKDLALTADALIRAKDDAGFLRLVAAHPSLPTTNLSAARHYAWKLFELGRMAESLAIARRLQTEDAGQHRDLQLEIVLAIETGAWETLATPLNDLLASAEQRSGLTLIRAAHIAHVSRQGSATDLINVALTKAPNDPNVLLGAYTIVLEEGLEEKRPEANEWFRKALDLSGPEGPIKRFELKELLTEQTAWNERTRKINDAIVQGTLPLAVAAQGLRTTLVDLLLRNLVGGSKQTDARKRSALPLFSGRRRPMNLGEVKKVALDSSAAIVLAWLGLLPKVLETYERIYLPASFLGELFEAFSRIRRFQRSQLTRAEETLAAIGRGGLKVHHSPAALRDPLAREVGVGFVSLLRGAEVANGVILHPAPLKRVGLDRDDDADVSAFSDRLVDLHCVLDALVNDGVIDEVSEDTARRYFSVQDKRWPNRPVLTKSTPLFLDDLALHYLQTVGLLEPVLRYFQHISIDKNTEDHARAVIQSAEDSDEIVAIIDQLRAAVNKAWSAEKLVFGPQHKHSTGEGDEDDGDDIGPDVSTINLLADLMQADLVVIDDRAFNKEVFAADRKGHRAHIATTLDVLEDLLTHNRLTEVEHRNLRHRLRLSGAVLVPVTQDEIVSATLRSKSRETAELRAIRESISLARMAKIPRFPSEIPWFAQTVLAIKHAVIRVWAEEPDRARAGRLAQALLDLRPRPAEWIEQWEGTPPPQWIDETEAVILASLAVPVDLTGDTLAAYQKWVDANLIDPIRKLRPDLYDNIVSKVRALLMAASKEGDKDV